MTRMLLNCLRKGAIAEAVLAVKALGLHILTLGLSEDVQRSDTQTLFIKLQNFDDIVFTTFITFTAQFSWS